MKLNSSEVKLQNKWMNNIVNNRSIHTIYGIKNQTRAHHQGISLPPPLKNLKQKNLVF